MRRPYNVRMYRDLVDRLASRIPSLGLGTDVIVGFPGETAGDFEATRSLVDALPFSYLHVFPYSDRQGTEAVTLPAHVGARVSADRSEVLRALSAAKSLAFRRSMIGTVQDVLVLEEADRTGRRSGLTGHYVEVTFDGPAALARHITPVRITGADEATTRGELT
jgi:threonylcarbamoyladenosine tRNA methylthiotransferase MtaB